MKKFILILFCMMMILGAGCSGGSLYDEQLKLGYKYLQEENYEEAIVAINKAIEIDEKRPDAYIGLGDVYVARCDENTVEDTNDALALGYKKSSSDKIIDAYIRLADELVKKDKADWAIRLLDMAYDNLGIKELQEKSEKLSEENPVQNYSEEVEAVGKILDNSLYYSEQWNRLLEDDKDMGIRAYGVFFSAPVEVEINGKKVAITEASAEISNEEMDHLFPQAGDVQPDINETWPYFNRELHLTGYFEEENVDSSGLQHNGEYITYCPNGNYLFVITGCKEYKD